MKLKIKYMFKLYLTFIFITCNLFAINVIDLDKNHINYINSEKLYVKYNSISNNIDRLKIDLSTNKNNYKCNDCIIYKTKLPFPIYNIFIDNKKVIGNINNYSFEIRYNKPFKKISIETPIKGNYQWYFYSIYSNKPIQFEKIPQLDYHLLKGKLNILLKLNINKPMYLTFEKFDNKTFKITPKNNVINLEYYSTFDVNWKYIVTYEDIEEYLKYKSFEGSSIIANLIIEYKDKKSNNIIKNDIVIEGLVSLPKNINNYKHFLFKEFKVPLVNNFNKPIYYKTLHNKIIKINPGEKVYIKINNPEYEDELIVIIIFIIFSFVIIYNMLLEKKYRKEYY